MSSTPQYVYPAPKSWKPPIEYDPNNTTAYPLPAPAGYTKQGIYGPSRANEVRIASAITIAVCFFVVVARLISKFAVTRTPGWEDYTCISAFLFAVGRVTDNYLQTEWYQLGMHSWDINTNTFVRAWQAYKIGYLFYLMAIMFAKLSIIILIFRLFSVKKFTRWVCYATGFMVFGYCFGFFWAFIFQCGSNVAMSWTYSQVKADCPARLPIMDITIGAFNIFTDSILLALPIPMIAKLHVTTRQLIGLIVVFSAGGLTLAVAIVREVLVVQTLNTGDTEWTSVDDVTWLTVEMNTAIICGCLPLLPPLIRNQTSRKVILYPYNSLVNLLSTRRSGSMDSRSRNRTNRTTTTRGDSTVPATQVEMNSWKESSVVGTATKVDASSLESQAFRDENGNSRIAVAHDVSLSSMEREYV